MKHKNLVLGLFVLLVSCQIEKIYKIGTTIENIKSKKSYLKDIDNDHLKVVGSWSSTDKNDSLTLVLKEFKRFNFPNNSNQFRDIVFGRYRYTKNGKIISEVKTIRPIPNSRLSFHYNSPTRYRVVISDAYSGKSKTGEFILTSDSTAILKLINTERIYFSQDEKAHRKFALPMTSKLIKD